MVKFPSQIKPEIQMLTIRRAPAPICGTIFLNSVIGSKYKLVIK